MSVVRCTSLALGGGLAVTVLCWVPGATSAHAEPVTSTYSSAVAGMAGDRPQSVATGDLDGDGDLDMATANGNSNDVTVLTRGPGGVYTSTVVGSTGTRPESVVMGDLDGDGDLDIATANSGSSDVTVLTRGPGGAYASAVAGRTGSNPYAVAMGDLDGDGDQDIATANYGSNNVTVLTRGPGGAYTSAVAGPTGGGPLSVAIGDLDSDGSQDLAVANHGSSDVTILSRSSGGTYTSAIAGTAGRPQSVAIGDVDEDGDQDLATAGADGVTVLSQGSSGAYTSALAGAAGSAPLSVVIGDLDSDGDADLATANSGSNDVTVLTRGPGGSYTSTVAGATGRSPWSLAVGDLDGDGDQDLATANAAEDNVSVLTNAAERQSPNYFATATVGTAQNGTPWSMAVADLDGDGDQDLATAQLGSDSVRLWTRGPGGTYTSTVARTGRSPRSVAVGDLDGDGDQDLVTANSGSDDVTVLTRGPDGGYTATVAGVTGTRPESVAIGDLDGDGDQDLATANAGSHNVTVLGRQPDGSYTSTVVGSTGYTPLSLAAGDLDGDGDQDLATANYNSDNVTVLTRGAGGTYTSTHVGTAGRIPRSVAIGDLDGDGDQDLATANDGSSNVTVLTRGAGGTYSSDIAGTTGSQPRSVAIGDLDGDGDQDLATANYGSSNVTVLTRGSTGAYASTSHDTTAARPVSVAIADLDSDGDQDFVTANYGASADVTIFTALLDQVAPTSTDDVPNAPRNAPVPVTLSATDTGGSGVKEVRYAVGTDPGTPTDLYDPSNKPTLGDGERIRYFAIDNAGNRETAHTSRAVQVDSTRPTVTLEAPTWPANGTFTVVAKFSEDVTMVGPSRYVVTNGTAHGVSGDRDTWTVQITPTAEGIVTVDLPAGSTSDAVGNVNTAATQLRRSVDLTRPTVTLSAPAGPHRGAFEVTAEFSEDVFELSASAFTLTNATVTGLSGTGRTFTALITPTGDGPVTIDLPAGSARDDAANTSTAATRLSRTVDSTRPTVTMSAPVGPLHGAFDVTAEFSEPVAGLSVSDFSATNATVDSVSGSGAGYTVTITPDAYGDVSLDLPAGAVADAAGNTNTAAVTLTRSVVMPTFTTGPDAAITGTPVVGGTLSATPGPDDLTATTPAADSYSYTWAGDGTPIAGAVGSTLTLDATRLGQTITVTITAQHDGHVDSTDTSVATEPVAAGTFTTGPDAVVTGDVVVGGTLTARPTDLDATTPAAASFTYAWAADGQPIVGATGSTLTLTAAEVGTRIRVSVTAKRDGYTEATDASEPTGPVAKAVFTAGTTATISGTAQVGQTLTAGTGAPVPDPESYRFVWYADSTPLAGATSATLTLTPAHRGRRISVAVTAVRAGYADATSISVPTAAIATDQAPALQLSLTVPQASQDAATTPDGQPTVRRGRTISLRWTSSNAHGLTATGELGDLMRARYGDQPIPATGRLRVRMDRAGAHVYRLSASNEAGTTIASAGIVAVRKPTRLTVETPPTARPGRTIRIRVTGLGYRELFYITLGDGHTTTRVRTGRANTHGNLVRRLTIPRTLPATATIRVRVTGRSTRRTGTAVIRLR
ncbi:beta strand repeat-containing protein [Nocardioides lijunqiniae]|uniref:beta strand repeat-containing protein n=1 Tax=Nocardioides lijunqiniae TaxID=2760832 RepID=UPI001878EDC0|nr:FG-GAP-like repeat-containing protein [Nocardioides lijunqiniae]